MDDYGEFGLQDSLLLAIRDLAVPVVLTDPRLPDNPISYVNRAFEEATLYKAHEAIGQNCRFLQGPDTSEEDLQAIRDGLASDRTFQAKITNYRKDGTPYRVQLMISPVHDREGAITGFLSLQRQLEGRDCANLMAREEAEALLCEVQHRVKNHLAMVSSMTRIQARHAVTRESFEAIGRRIEALALLYEEMLGSRTRQDANEKVSLNAYLRRIADVVADLESQRRISVTVDCGDVSLGLDQAASLGLLVSECLTNALAHAFEGRESGDILVLGSPVGDSDLRLSITDNGIGMPEGHDWPASAMKAYSDPESGHGVGGAIVLALARSLGGKIEVASAPETGTSIAIQFPIR